MIKQHYKIKRTSDFGEAQPAFISNNNWNKKSAPKTEAKIILDGEDLKVSLLCHETNPLAKYTKNYDPVYLDSCMECFFNFNPSEASYYINTEVNSNGAFLCCVGDGREERERVIDRFGILPEVNVNKTAESWEAVITIPSELIKKAYGVTLASGLAFIGNLYKCEEASDTPNFLSWSPIETEKPDFHCPRFFGTFEIE